MGNHDPYSDRRPLAGSVGMTKRAFTMLLAGRRGPPGGSGLFLVADEWGLRFSMKAFIAS